MDHTYRIVIGYQIDHTYRIVPGFQIDHIYRIDLLAPDFFLLFTSLIVICCMVS